jgi:uncharacterized protein YbjT (DUF2867 family)
MTISICYGTGRVLITGATGLLGRRLVQILGTPAWGREVIVMVRRPEQQAEYESQGVRAVLEDLTLPRLVSIASWNPR